MNASIRTRPVTRTLLAGLALLALATTVRANEVAGAVRASGLVIHDAESTLRDYCTWEGDRLVFNAPGGATWELITTTGDPAITNKGDGAFHPFEALEVRSALEGVRFPLARVAAEVFLLPFPRRLGLDSAAGPGLILLSPGVRALSADQQHAEFTHELGHVVQYVLLPDADTLRWTHYRELRGIRDRLTFSGGAVHSDRPHEIFAEDFRALFGDARATSTGTIENSELAYPTGIPGLAAWMTELTGTPASATPLSLARGAAGSVGFSRGGPGAPALELFDVTGRRVVTLAPSAHANGCVWSWDGRDASGARVRGAVLFARARDGIGGVAKLTVAP